MVAKRHSGGRPPIVKTEADRVELDSELEELKRRLGYSDELYDLHARFVLRIVRLARL